MPTADLPLIRLLEELGANALGTEITETVGGWRLRAAPNAPFRRANSVLPLDSDDTPVGPRIEQVERFYADRGLPARYQLSPAASPSDLDAALEERGYRYDAPVVVLTADAAMVSERTGPGDTDISSEIDGHWIEEYADAHGDDAVARARLTYYGRLLQELPGAVAAVVARREKKVVGIGLGVREHGWVGVYAMGTRPEARRRGAARAVLRQLAEWAQAAHGERMYLQVEEDTAPARALYENAGFSPVDNYWYRVEA